MENKNRLLSIITALFGFVLIIMGLYLHLSSSADISPKEKNVICGYLWKARDGSMLYLYSDNSFVWYKEDNVFDDNYYLGTYEVYKSEEAIQYVSNSLRRYGVTEEEQNQIIKGTESKIPNAVEFYYALILNNESSVVSSTARNNKYVTPFVGFYYEEKEYLDFTNLNSANYSGFTRVRVLKGKENFPL